MADPERHCGDEVYKRLMDLDLILQDISAMGPLRMLLGSMPTNTQALRKVRKEVEDFIAMVEGLVAAAKVATKT